MYGPGENGRVLLERLRMRGQHCGAAIFEGGSSRVQEALETHRGFPRIVFVRASPRRGRCSKAAVPACRRCLASTPSPPRPTAGDVDHA
ncbi:hypothetical protein AAFF_G00239740 [Aldrovandia affinis]|uniref:Uncharacterized protein n=1 Tax=Aldrovandia affinis TaxID=143900 RepID=A0AAD7SUK2_9TELE|nr:hypothetical protein AAFF_G00239740 [Aldrovandia affinis]